MATFNFDDYQKQQAARQAASGNKGDRTPIHFMGEWLAKDGDSVVVRFPYTSTADLQFETVHKVIGVFANNKFGKSVRCTGNGDCPLCNSTDESVKKKSTKFYAKMVVYNPTATGAELCATIWERPSMFADSDLKNLMAEYGDLSNYLFKITRTGKGTDTRYNIIPVNMASPVYSKDVYKTKDLSCLENVDATKILSKGMDQYLDALNGGTGEGEKETESKPEEFKVPENKEVDQALGLNATTNNFIPKEEEVQVTVNEVKQPDPQPTTTSTSGGTTRYRF